MKKIWKAILHPAGEVWFPEHSTFLTVTTQQNKPYIYALVNTYYPARLYRFHIFGTGHHVTEPGASLPYLGTFSITEHNDPLVFHVFGPET